MQSVFGIHHITAIAGEPQRNLDFYAGVLGLRFVKRTVNFDDPETYHFYFGDETGTPGTILTFFPWPGAGRGRRGTGQVAVITFAVRSGALTFWAQRLEQHGVSFDLSASPHRTLRESNRIRFTDPDGLTLELVEDDTAGEMRAWVHVPGIAGEDAIRGFESVTLWSRSGDRTEQLLVDTLGFRVVARDRDLLDFVVADGRPGQRVTLQAADHVSHGLGGAGVVHHIAWRVPGDGAQLEVREQLLAAGLEPTPVIDRQYFHSVYFREPGGILFELATDTPGFLIDEPVERLGESLMLPPQYEPYRRELEAILPVIHLPVAPADDAPILQATGPEDVSGEALGFVHRYLPPRADADLAGGTTLLLLHGTGGDEDDLIPLGRALRPGAGILSPRGKVLENGAHRFFRRLADGVFDQEDLANRTDELATFITGATKTYSLEADGIVAVGFSNGANIAASLLLRHPGLLRAAVLLSPMVPFMPDTVPDLAGTAVFIGAGRRDAMVPHAETERLAELLRHAGADLAVHWEPDGHAIGAGEVAAVREWMTRRVSALRDVG